MQLYRPAPGNAKDDSRRFDINAPSADCVEPLADLLGFSVARQALLATLAKMDQDEIEHFGGYNKHQQLMTYLSIE